MQFADKFVTKLVADTLNFNDETKKEETKETKNESIITNNKPVKNASLDNLNDAIAKFKAGEITLEEYQAIKDAFIKSLYK